MKAKYLLWSGLIIIVLVIASYDIKLAFFVFGASLVIAGFAIWMSDNKVISVEK